MSSNRPTFTIAAIMLLTLGAAILAWHLTSPSELRFAVVATCWPAIAVLARSNRRPVLTAAILGAVLAIAMIASDVAYNGLSVRAAIIAALVFCPGMALMSSLIAIVANWICKRIFTP